MFNAVLVYSVRYSLNMGGKKQKGPNLTAKYLLTLWQKGHTDSGGKWITVPVYCLCC